MGVQQRSGEIPHRLRKDTGPSGNPGQPPGVGAGALFLIPRGPLGPFLAPLFCGNSGVVLSHMLHI